MFKSLDKYLKLSPNPENDILPVSFSSRFFNLPVFFTPHSLVFSNIVQVLPMLLPVLPQRDQSGKLAFSQMDSKTFCLRVGSATTQGYRHTLSSVRTPSWCIIQARSQKNHTDMSLNPSTHKQGWIM